MPAKLTTKKFIQKARAIHGDTYDYSEVEYIGSMNVVNIYCPKHGEFNQTPNIHLKGHGCPTCGIKQRNEKHKKNLDFFLKKAKTIHGDTYDYSKFVYTTYKTKSTVICRRHGEFQQTPNSHLGGYGCRECFKDRIKSSKEVFVEKSIEIHGDKYLYHKVKYEHCRQPVTITCKLHGDFEKTPSSHLAGVGCPECGIISNSEKRASNTRDFIKKAKNVHGDLFDYSEVNYTNARSKVSIICPKHGVWEPTANSHLQGYGCPVCRDESSAARNTLSTEKFKQRSLESHTIRYNYEHSIYKGYALPIKIECPEHGVFEQEAGHHMNGGDCPLCAINGPSKGELNVLDFIKSICPYKVIRGDRSAIAPKEIDIYIPEIKIGIEFNGIYFHSDTIKEDKNYHKNKTEACLNQGITLIHIFSNEWERSPEIVKSRLKHILKRQTRRIYARKCKIKMLSKEESKEFFNRTHIQGHVGYRLAYGLFYENELVSAMSFGKPRYNQSADWELMRFTTALDTSVVGGASKLFKAFLLDTNPESVVSYADRRWSNGNLYQTLGFEFTRVSKPNYFYFKGNAPVLHSRVTFQKHKLSGLLDTFDNKLTEYENMRNNGYHRIFDCGNAVYTYRNC